MTQTSWHPPRRLLEFVELVLSGALDRLPEPVEAPDSVVSAVATEGAALLEDAEGTPVATLLPGGEVGPAKPFAQGPLRGRRLSPEAVRARLGSAGDRVVAVVSEGALSVAQVEAAARAQPAVWLVLVGDGRRVDLPPAAALRAAEAAADSVDDAGTVEGARALLVVPVAVPRLLDESADVRLVEAVARAHGATEVMHLTSESPGLMRPAWHDASARELARAVRPPSTRGVTLFFTGLSGSGKSTVAKAVAERIEQWPGQARTHSLLDGDEVRRLLSAGLSFSRADRDLNIRRIGFVATEVTRHGGLAICAPIAPFEQARAQVREDVQEVGDFVLVYVDTPLHECERRDRKGLYAQARAGLIADFTGISSPYEAPEDADLRLDTSTLSVDEAVSQVVDLLVGRGYLA